MSDETSHANNAFLNSEHTCRPDVSPILSSKMLWSLPPGSTSELPAKWYLQRARPVRNHRDRPADGHVQVGLEPTLTTNFLLISKELVETSSQSN